MQKALQWQKHAILFFAISWFVLFDSSQAIWQSSTPMSLRCLRGGGMGMSNSSDGGVNYGYWGRTTEGSTVALEHGPSNSAGAPTRAGFLDIMACEGLLQMMLYLAAKAGDLWTQVSAQSLQSQHFQIPPVEGFFWAHGLCVAGLSVEQDSKRLFARNDTRTLWDKLDKAEFGVFVDGAPGTGKSCSVWAWLCNQALNSMRSFLWIHLEEGMEPVVLRYKDGFLYSGQVHLRDLQGIIEAADTDIVVLDGVTLNMDIDAQLRAALFSTTAKGKSIRISVTSLGTRIKYKIRVKYSKLGIRFHEMSLWALEEARRACSDRYFFQSVAIALGFGEPEVTQYMGQTMLTRSWDDKINKAVETKYFFSGGSARWLFDYTVAEVKAAVQDALDSVEDYNTLLEKRVGITNPTCSNTLVVRYTSTIPDALDAADGDQGSNLFFVSHYVTRTVLRKCSIASLQTAYELAAKHNNPAFGWVAEFDFISQLEHIAKSSLGTRCIKLFEIDNLTPLMVSVPALVEFSADNLGNMKDKILEFAWLRPAKWNEAGYDLVRFENRKYGKFHFRSRPILHFLQVTRGDQHELNLRPFLKLAETIRSLGIRIDGIDITFILPIFGGRSVRKPALSLLNEGDLSSFFVGAGPLKWQTLLERSQVRFLGFTAVSARASK